MFVTIFENRFCDEFKPGFISRTSKAFLFFFKEKKWSFCKLRLMTQSFQTEAHLSKTAVQNPSFILWSSNRGLKCGVGVKYNHPAAAQCVFVCRFVSEHLTSRLRPNMHQCLGTPHKCIFFILSPNQTSLATPSSWCQVSNNFTFAQTYH